MSEFPPTHSLESPEQIRANQARTQQVWVNFLASPERIGNAIPDGASVSRYRIERVVAISARTPIQAGWELLRIETDRPSTDSMCDPSVVRLQGVTQHLHYTNEVEKANLAARSRKEIQPSETTRAVLIPIRKSQEWWQLAQDRRGAHFHGDRDHPGHTPIGAPYVERIFRKLYHARFIDPANPWDFLAYLEFAEADRQAFEELLGKLRDVKLNPEWSYVESEFEIWMTKTA